ncbi:hypothetical protein BCR33DRAFT_393718 [Rhizoclosmatium globosum]|uniref:Uncharacterized protein n=1 Tax=Rhizoclosmatium globosum TaxID=329046 RepID=A0A1Y2BY49_9FUNG|nr:hypothetical protein BCR33DRAFT_393718 [Rhizoclosmatium globosum]|eukprot:ORY39666.1 hypothetical protein BCR33DRAFT_393718 [Rhizoclosmatium globosum]
MATRFSKETVCGPDVAGRLSLDDETQISFCHWFDGLEKLDVGVVRLSDLGGGILRGWAAGWGEKERSLRETGGDGRRGGGEKERSLRETGGEGRRGGGEKDLSRRFTGGDGRRGGGEKERSLRPTDTEGTAWRR